MRVVEGMSSKLQRVRELYSDGGLNEVSRGVRDFIYYRTVRGSTIDYHGERIDNDDRWEYIEPRVRAASSVIDIGCAEGFFTRKAASAGAFSVGIESERERVSRARERADALDNCAFMCAILSPETVRQLPQVDTILLMTVHHHWEQAYGLDAAERMFQVVLDRCDSLVYEPPGDRPLIKKQSRELDPNDSLEYYTGRLQALYNSLEIEDSRLFEHSEDFKNPRKDPVFIIDCSSYSL